MLHRQSGSLIRVVACLCITMAVFCRRRIGFQGIGYLGKTFLLARCISNLIGGMGMLLIWANEAIKHFFGCGMDFDESLVDFSALVGDGLRSSSFTGWHLRRLWLSGVLGFDAGLSLRADAEAGALPCRLYMDEFLAWEDHVFHAQGS